MRTSSESGTDDSANVNAHDENGIVRISVAA